MKVVFMSDVEGTAQVGEVKDVKPGFARNYLLPRGLAAPAVEPYLGWAEKRAVREAKHQTELDAHATAAASLLEGTRITMPARVGETGRLYGSVTSVHIAAEVAKLLGDEQFDHRKVLLPEAIKEVGVQPVRLRLTRNVETAIEVEVYAEGEEPGAAVAEEPMEETAEAPEAEAEAEGEEEAEIASDEEAEDESEEDSDGEDA